MLEYPVDDAIVLLSKNLETAKSSLLQVDEDLDFLKDQCTTIEVGILPKIKKCMALFDVRECQCTFYLNAFPRYGTSVQLGR